VEAKKMTRQTNAIVRRCKRALEHHYGPQLQGLVLYGSVARRRAEPESDIDLLVLLAQPFDYSRELRQLVDVLYPIQLESDKVISALPAAADEFEGGTRLLYRNARKDGVYL
jgi:predicted nucleotidyltransferase